MKRCEFLSESVFIGLLTDFFFLFSFLQLAYFLSHDKCSTTVVCSFRYARCGFCFKIIGKNSRVCGENHVALQRVHTEPISGPNGIPFSIGRDPSRHGDLPPSSDGLTSQREFNASKKMLSAHTAFGGNEWKPAANEFLVNHGASTSSGLVNSPRNEFLAKNVMKKDVCMGFNVYDKGEFFISLFHFSKFKIFVFFVNFLRLWYFKKKIPACLSINFSAFLIMDFTLLIFSC